VSLILVYQVTPRNLETPFKRQFRECFNFCTSWFYRNL